MSEGWKDRDPDEPDYEMVLPFLDESPSFTHGFEVGWQYGRMKYGAGRSFQQTVHSENQRQLMMAANKAGWAVRFEPIDETFSEMHASHV